MKHYDRRTIALAVCLSGVAGYADAIGFISLGGFFVSFMSGNSTRLAVALGRDDVVQAEMAGGIIFCFLAGVMLGTAIGVKAERWRRPLILGSVAVLLALASFLDAIRVPFLAVVPLAMAMGAENTLLERNGEVSIGLTYMTGALVKMGQGMAQALMGGERWSWLPYFLLWAGLIVGAAAGTIAYGLYAFQALWLAAIAAALCALFGIRR